MARNVPAFLLLICLACVPAANAEGVLDLLNQQYKNQILPLRVAFNHGGQEVASSGQPMKAASTEPWLVYGGITVQKITLSSDTLLLEGPRIAFTGAYKHGNPSVVPLGKPVKVQIRLDHPIDTLEEAQTLLSRVFYLDKSDIDRAKPEYRRADFSSAEADIERHPLQIGKDGVKPPKPLYTPEPEFSQEARYARYDATVVMDIVLDKSGAVSGIKLEKAVGSGLDEKAVEAVKHWRFEPATRDGQPVPITMRIEVAFKLF